MPQSSNDPMNSLTNVNATALANDLMLSIDMDELGRPSAVQYGNGVDGSFTWDEASRISGLNYANNGSAFVERAYTHDLHGNMASMTIADGLLPQIAPGMKRLQQNPADELTAIQTKANPGVPDWNTVSASHDLEGNLTGDGNFTFAYDYENRLVDVTGTGTQVSSSYAGDGGRVARSSSGETRIHVLDHGAGLQPVLMEVGTNGVPVRFYIWAGVLAAHVDAGGEVRFYHADHQGSTIALTDENGTVTDQWFHDPYGETLNRTGTTDTPYQWVGGYAVWNEGQGLYRMQARHYHTGLKRFTTTDPLGVQELLGRGGLANLYQYANNSPLVYIDPDGEWVWVAAGALIGAAIDGGMALRSELMSDGPVNLRNVGAATARGALVGTVSALAGPAAGTLVKGAGGLATGLGAKAIASGIAATGSVAGQATYNTIAGNNFTDGMGEAALLGAGGQALGSLIPVRGVSTLKQARYFAPQHVSSMAATENARRLTFSYIASSSVGSLPNVFSLSEANAYNVGESQRMTPAFSGQSIGGQNVPRK